MNRMRESDFCGLFKADKEMRLERIIKANNYSGS